MQDADPTLQANALPESLLSPPDSTSPGSAPPATVSPREDRRQPANATQRQIWMDTSAADRELERMHHGTPIQCQFCVGQKFRRSRLRGADIRQLLLMRYPVRCTRCSQRQTVSFTVAGVSVPSYLRQRDGRPSRSTRPAPDSAGLPANRAGVSPDAASPHDPATDA